MKRRLLRYALALLVAWLLAWFGLPWLVPLPQRLLEPVPMGQRFLAQDGTPLRHVLSQEGQRAMEPLSVEQLPQHLVNALLAAEDHRFFSHGGVDGVALLRAIKERVTGSGSSGASTLTMQLIKISESPRRPRSLSTKLLEALAARQLELRWEKQRILSEYLNRVEFGNLFIGISAASWGYFSKPVSDLSLAEAAYLAALPQAPSRWSPFLDREAVRPRQKRILQRMKELGWVEREELKLALAELPVIRAHRGGFIAPHAVALAQSGTQKDGTVQTTIDAALQKAVEGMVEHRVSTLHTRGAEQAAVVVIENSTGHVLALVGSRDYRSAAGGQINGTWEPRSPGSALKPFTYALAMNQSGGPANLVTDLPAEYAAQEGTYRPENYDGRSYGPMTYRTALGNSLNLSAVRVLDRLGGAPALHGALTELGLTTLTEKPEHYGLGLTIGNAPVRLLELTNAYATLARLGHWQPWHLLPQNSNKVTDTLLSKSWISPTAAWFVADILSDSAARAITFGNQSVLRLPFPAAVKTGTSTNYRDNWCLGYVPEFTVGVWVGNFSGRPMQEITGVSGAAPLWRDVMLKLRAQHGTSWYTEPEGLERGRIDLRTGKRLSTAVPGGKHTRTEVWLKARPPAPAQRSDYEADSGKAILPPEYAQWIKSRDNWLGDSVTTATKGRFQELKILSPAPGTILIRGQALRLIAEPADGVQWLSDTLRFSTDSTGTTWATALRPGKHTLAARRGEATARTMLEVKP